MKRYLIVLIGVVVLLPSCLTFRVYRELEYLDQAGFDRTNEHVEVKQLEQLVSERDILESVVMNGISRQDAVHIALRNNRELQAALQDIGIYKAELVQAGLLTNPQLDSAHVRQLADEIAPIEFEFANLVHFNLDDLWKKPFEARVARDELAVILARLEKKIIDIKARTERAYNFCLFAVEKLAAAEVFIRRIRDFRAIITKYTDEEKVKEFGVPIATIILGTEINRREEAASEVRVGFARLRRVMGLNVEYDTFPLTDNLLDLLRPQPIIDDLVAESLENHPDVHVAVSRVERARHIVSRERANVIPGSVELGFATVNAPGGNGFGPAFTIDVPIFDQNQAQITRAKFLFDQAEKEFLRTRIKLKKDVLKFHDELQKTLEQIKTFEEVIKPAIDQGRRYIYKIQREYAERASDKVKTDEETKLETYDLVNLLQEFDRFFDLDVRYLEMARRELDSYAKLELAVGRKIPFSVHTISKLFKNAE